MNYPPWLTPKEVYSEPKQDVFGYKEAYSKLTEMSMPDSMHLFGDLTAAQMLKRIETLQKTWEGNNYFEEGLILGLYAVPEDVVRLSFNLSFDFSIGAFAVLRLFDFAFRFLLHYTPPTY